MNVNRSFGGTIRLHLQRRRINQETSVKVQQRHLPPKRLLTFKGL
jgi:hypothetical protein